MKKLFLQIGAGFWSEKIINHYADLGYVIALTDKSKIPPSCSDYIFKQVDGSNSRLIALFAQELSRKYEIEKINIAGEFAIETLAKLSRETFINCLSKFDEKYFINKIDFSEILKQNKISSQIKLNKCKSSNLIDIIKSFELPLVIKPVAGRGGSNVFLLKLQKDVDKFISLSLKNSYIGKEDSECFLVEKLIDGEEFNIYGEIENGEYKIYSIIKKVNSINNINPVWSRSYLLHENELSRFVDLKADIIMIAKSIGYTKGFLCCAVILTDNSNYFLEFVPMIGLDHILLSENYEHDISLPKDIKRKSNTSSDNGKTVSKALLAINYNDMKLINSSHIDFFNKTFGRTELNVMPRKNNIKLSSKGATGNSCIAAFLYAESESKNYIEDLFEKVITNHD